jgi:16S rRNA (cytidine1402-2'-O)-methyltransferase
MATETKDSQQLPSATADQTGSLFVVATPIGNLGDITLRALETLKSVDLVACEDTRRTGQMLQHYGIQTPTTSYHEHNELTKSAELVLLLEEGSKVALVSDAGMPGISDPGYRLISLCIRHHIPVVPIPGASAFVAALVASGLPTDAFLFIGFLPPKKGQRRKALEAHKASDKTLIFYEAPHRAVECLEAMLEVMGNRQIVLAREVTKLHEEFLRGRCEDVLVELRGRDRVQGEITILVGRSEEEPHAYTDVPLRARIEQLMREQGVERMAALKAVARERGISKRQAYREYEETE